MIDLGQSARRAGRVARVYLIRLARLSPWLLWPAVAAGYMVLFLAAWHLAR